MKKLLVVLLMLFALVMVSCTTHVHTVGNGPQSGQVETARQWFILFGLIPLNDVDTGAMAGGVVDYQIQTQTTGLDILIGIPASYVTVSSRTVTVTK